MLQSLIIHSYGIIHFTSTYRDSIEVVSLQVLLGSYDVLGQVQTVKRKVDIRLQLLLPPALVGEAAENDLEKKNGVKILTPRETQKYISHKDFRQIVI